MKGEPYERVRSLSIYLKSHDVTERKFGIHRGS